MSTQSSEKLGLGLSGGGFRASFYHIGILAQMAEQGLLRSVEVISTVSGGSVIGALYYLHLKKLLESKVDDDITDQDYIDIVKIIEVDFLKATEKNIRMATFGNFIKNFKMLISSNYSRSSRIAELYNDYFYQSVLEDESNPIEMQNLKIYPPGCESNFFPRKDNATRSAKVPILILNATTLNGGRNWQFTAQTMGEPSNYIPDTASKFIYIDKKPIRLRRARNGYQSMVKQQQHISLGHAVAASASVPGLFSPLSIKGLYDNRDKEEEVTPQLVDGGVFDNQGTESLLNNDCTQFIISDASGQMGFESQVDTKPIPTLLRVSTILQDRARTEGLLHLIARTDNIDNIAFMNLRKGLEVREISWNNEYNEPAEKDEIFESTTNAFGVNDKVQEKLSKMRTDLDAFTEVEAYSLMRDGYLMSATELSQLKQTSKENKTQAPPKVSWAFNQIAPWMNKPTPDYLKQLDVAQSTFGKVLQIFVWLWIPIILAIGGLLYYYWPELQQFVLSSFPVYPIVIILALWIANKFALTLLTLLPFLNFLRAPFQGVKGFIKAVIFSPGAIFIRIYLLCFNPLYLAQGRIAKLKK
ncbi:MAG: patatin-like phospholipase family protein [Methylococcales bacterium]|nr:patatin-like phospholipase family protein [Methylococcales bacterium]